MARFHFGEFSTMATELVVEDVPMNETPATFRADLHEFFKECKDEDLSFTPEIFMRITCPQPIPPWAAAILHEEIPNQQKGPL